MGIEGFDQKLERIKEQVKKIYSTACENAKQKVLDDEREIKKIDDQLRTFNEHNDVVLNFVTKLGEELQLNQDDMQILMVSSALHDVSKFDVPLVLHGFEGAKKAKEILVDIGGFDDAFINKVSEAIVKHMGPIPGFMEKQREIWDSKYPDKSIGQFPRPESIIEKLLYDADMLALIASPGIKKIISIRGLNKDFIEEDIREARRRSIVAKQNVSRNEVVWGSALDSAKSAYNSLYTQQAKDTGRDLLDALEGDFDRLGEIGRTLRSYEIGGDEKDQDHMYEIIQRAKREDITIRDAAWELGLERAKREGDLLLKTDVAKGELGEILRKSKEALQARREANHDLRNGIRAKGQQRDSM